jgi:Zn-dependent M28 family amino/carboxypeptidase
VILIILRHEQGLEPTNKIRFAWWGSEETGLIGSRNYVAAHTDLKAEVALYLNFDMLASPNFIPGVCLEGTKEG